MNSYEDILSFTIDKKIPVYYMNNILINRGRRISKNKPRFYNSDLYETYCDELQEYFDRVQGLPVVNIELSEPLQKYFKQNETSLIKIERMMKDVFEKLTQNGIIQSILTYFGNNYKKLAQKYTFTYISGSIYKERTGVFKGHHFELGGMSYSTLRSEESVKNRLKIVGESFQTYFNDLIYLVVIEKIEDDLVEVKIDIDSTLKDIIESTSRQYSIQSNIPEEGINKRFNLNIEGIQILDNNSDKIYDISINGTSEMLVYLGITGSIIELDERYKEKLPNEDFKYEKFNKESFEDFVLSLNESGLCEMDTEMTLYPKEIKRFSENSEKISREDMMIYRYINNITGKAVLKSKCNWRRKREKFGPMCQNFEPSKFIVFNFRIDILQENGKIVSTGYTSIRFNILNLIRKLKDDFFRIYELKDEKDNKYYEDFFKSNVDYIGTYNKNDVIIDDDQYIIDENPDVEEFCSDYTAMINNFPLLNNLYGKFEIIFDSERGWRIFNVYKRNDKSFFPVFGNEKLKNNKWYQSQYDKLDNNDKYVVSNINEFLSAAFKQFKQYTNKTHMKLDRIEITKEFDNTIRVKPMYRNRIDDELDEDDDE